MDDTKIWTDGIEVIHFDKDGEYVKILGHKIDRNFESFDAFIEEMKSLTDFKEKIANNIYYDIKKMSAQELYDVICAELSFNTVIELYDLLEYKIEH